MRGKKGNLLPQMGHPWRRVDSIVLKGGCCTSHQEPCGGGGGGQVRGEKQGEQQEVQEEALID